MLSPTSIKNTNIYIYILTYVFRVMSKAKQKKAKKRGSVPRTGAGVLRFMQVLQVKGNCRYDFLDCHW
jgi:hypothetical protein